MLLINVLLAILGALLVMVQLQVIVSLALVLDQLHYSQMVPVQLVILPVKLVMDHHPQIA